MQWSSENIAEKISRKVHQFFGECPKLALKHLKQKNFLDSFHLDTKYVVLTTPLLFFEKMQIFVAQCAKLNRNNNFFWKKYSPEKVVPMEPYKAVWTSWLKLFRKNDEMFSLSIWKRNKKTNRVLSKKYFYRKCSNGHLVCSFENPAGSFLTKCRKVFAQCSKMTEQKQRFQENLLQKVRLKTQNLIITTTTGKLDRRLWKDLSSFKNSAKVFPRKNFPWTIVWSFASPVLNLIP